MISWFALAPYFSPGVYWAVPETDEHWMTGTQPSGVTSAWAWVPAVATAMAAMASVARRDVRCMVFELLFRVV